MPAAPCPTTNVAQASFVSREVVRLAVRAGRGAVGALPHGRLRLQLRLPHPQRVLEVVLAGPPAPATRSDRPPTAPVGPFGPPGEDRVPRGRRGAADGHGRRYWPVLARHRRHVYRDRAGLPHLPHRPAGPGRGVHRLRRHLPPRRRPAFLGPPALRSRIVGRPDLFLARPRHLRRRTVDPLRRGMGLAGPLASSGRHHLIPAKETLQQSRPRKPVTPQDEGLPWPSLALRLCTGGFRDVVGRFANRPTKNRSPRTPRPARNAPY